MPGKNYTHGKAIRCLESTTGDLEIHIVARDDGRFQYYAYDKLPADKGGQWTLRKMSGLYESVETTELEARAAFSQIALS